MSKFKKNLAIIAIAIAIAIAIGLVGCGTRGPTIEEADAELMKLNTVAPPRVRDAVTPDMCPPGYFAPKRIISTYSKTDISNLNRAVAYVGAFGGASAQECVPQK